MTDAHQTGTVPADSSIGMEPLATAWKWVLKLREESVTESDLTEWLAWYETSEAHRQAFESVQTLWRGAQGVLEGPDASTLQELLGGSGAGARRPPTRRKSERTPWLSRPALSVAAAMALALIVFGSVFFLRRLPHATSISQTPLLARSVPPVRKELLPDGSRVDLAPKSKLVLNFTKSLRSVDLKGGEAYFAVVHNRLRPFVVSVGDVRVVDLGTQFNVRKAGGRIVVTVFKGEVDASRASGRENSGVTLRAGQQAIWTSGSSEARVVRANLTRTLAWQQGQLEYLDEPLANVIADVNRYTKRKVVIADPSVGRLLFSGTVFTDATSVWIEALPHVFPVRLASDAQGNWVLTRSGRQ